MKKFVFLVIMIAFAWNMQAQNDDDDVVSLTTAQDEAVKQDIIKKGISFGPLPIIAFDQDKGLQYGGLLNIFDFGDGSNYPHPRQQWYIESS